jgi:hypothetical protein
LDGAVTLTPDPRLAPRLRFLLSWRHGEDERCGHPRFDTNRSILLTELIEKSHKVGILVFSDSLADEHEKLEEYLKAIGWGIDRIQTSHPRRVLWAVERFKQQKP